MKKIRVLIVEDHPFFRSGLAQWLNQHERVTCCGEAGSVAEARQVIASSLPDVILMDLRLGDGEGLELIAEVMREHPLIRIIALSQFDENIYAHRALETGARGYLMKSEATESVLAAIQTVMDANPDKVAEYRSGKDKLFGFFVGQVMRAMAGKAAPGVVNDRLKALLDG